MRGCLYSERRTNECIKVKKPGKGTNHWVVPSDAELEGLRCIIHFRGSAVLRQESGVVNESCHVPGKLERGSDLARQPCLFTSQQSNHQR